MKQHITKVCFCLISVTALLNSNAFAQSIKRQSVGSGGNEVYSEGLIIHQSIGQSYSTSTNYDNGVSFMPGFQQTSSFRVEIIEAKMDLSLFPNPTSYSFTIESLESLSSVSIEIFDESGKVIFTEKSPSLLKKSIACDTWQNGTYLIKVSDSSGRPYSSKLIINK